MKSQAEEERAAKKKWWNKEYVGKIAPVHRWVIGSHDNKKRSDSQESNGKGSK